MKSYQYRLDAYPHEALINLRSNFMLMQTQANRRCRTFL